MKKLYEEWAKAKTPDATKKFLQEARPVIDMGVKMYAGQDDPAARAQAKVLVSRALKSYDPSRGTKIKTHILNQMQPLRRFAAARRTVTHIPETVQREAAQLHTTAAELQDKLDREPTLAELADATGLSLRRVQNLHSRGWTVPEASRMTEEGEINQAVVDIPGALDTWTDYVYHDLNPVDRKIFEWRTGFGGKKKLSNNEIARKLRLTPGAVTQRADRIAQRIEEGLRYGSGNANIP